MGQVGISAVFTANGEAQVQQVQIDERWLGVEQGRQWLDDNGRHILIMLPGNSVRELVLRRDTLVWEIKSLPGGKQIV